MKKLDKRKKFYLVLDTETANGLNDPLVYDIGFCVIDRKGTVYHTESLLIYEVYRGERELMKTCYYANKLEMYERQYKEGLRRIVKWATAKKILEKVCKEYNVSAIMAHNAFFDYKATNTTQRFLTKSQYRYFLPYGIPIWCTMTMAKDTIAKQKSYIRFCEQKVDERIFRGKPRVSAEILYQYIIGDGTFKEEHTALADCLIEKDIFVRCMAQHKKMRKSPWKERKSQEPQERTPLIDRILQAAKTQEGFAF